jgi:hypothetical protein
MSSTNNRWLQFCIGIYAIASLLFPIPQYFFLYDSTNWRPRDWFIGFSILYGVLLAYVIFEIVSRMRIAKPKQRSSKSSSSSSAVSDPLSPPASEINEYVLEFGYHAVTVYLIVFLVNVLWLDNTDGLISSTNTVNYLSGENGNTPNAPKPLNSGYLDFRAVSVITIFMLNHMFIRSAVLYMTIDMTNAPTKPSGAPRDGSEMAYRFYQFSTIFMYGLTAIYLLIFFVHSFENDAPLRLQGMFVLYVFIVCTYLLRLLCFYLFAPAAANRIFSKFTQEVQNQTKGKIEFYRLHVTEQLVWVFLVVWDAYFYTYYYGNEFDMKDSPQLDRNIIQQDGAWYVFQNHAVIRGAQIVEFVSMAVLVFVLFSGKTRDDSTDKDLRFSKKWLMWGWVIISWTCVLVLISFNLTSAAGYAWLAIVFARYAISVYSIGAVIGVLAVFVVRYCKNCYKVASSTLVTIEWIVYVERITYAVPAFILFLFIAISVPFYKYNDLGRESMQELLNVPLTTPVNSVTYYWANTYLITLLMIFHILFIMLDSPALKIIRKLS